MTAYTSIVVMNKHDRVERTKGIKPMNETIYTQESGKYHVQKTVGGYVVVFIEDRNTARNVDGGKVHKSRQNAWAKADQLNHPIKHALKKCGMAEAEYGSGYIANVTEGDYPGDYLEYRHQFSLTLRQDMI